MHTIKNTIESLEQLISDLDSGDLSNSTIQDWLYTDVQKLRALVGLNEGSPNTINDSNPPEEKVLLKELCFSLRKDNTVDFSGLWNGKDFDPIPNEYWNEKAYHGSVLRLKSDLCSAILEYKSDDGFTRKQLFESVLSYDSLTRPKTDWFGLPDWHHVFFEGIHFNEDGVGIIYWGS